jgi:hypothetical protein
MYIHECPQNTATVTIIIIYTLKDCNAGLKRYICNNYQVSRVMTSAQSDQDPCCLLSVSLLVIEFVCEQHGS